MRPIVLIPSRLQATRLPNKPLADIGGVPMIVQVWRRAREADVGPVLVAAGDPEIVAAIKDHGGAAVMTRSGHPTGSDRIFEALGLADPDGRHDVVVNVQGDLPTVEPKVVRAALAPLTLDPAVDIGTVAARITRIEELHEPSVVKIAVAFTRTSADGFEVGRAHYFSRATIPAGDGPVWHHIGLYTYRRAALTRFVALPPSPLEKRERLEQLRALEAGMRVDVARVDTVPLGVDTPDDLARARAMLGT